MKKKILCLMIAFLLSFFLAPTCYAEALSVDTMMQSQLQLFDWDDIGDLERELKEKAPYVQDFDLKQEVEDLLTGKKTFSIGTILTTIGELFFSEIETYISLIIRFILIALLCSLLQTLSSSFKSKDTTKVAFLVCYLLIIYTVSESLFVIVNLAQSTIGNLQEMMRVTLPTLLAFMAVSGYITSSSALATIIVGTMNVMTYALQHFILPIIIGLIILQVIGSMSEEIKIDKFIKLFYKGVKWGLRGVLTIAIFVMGIYKLTLPYVDVALKKSAINLSTSFIPVVGDASRGAIEFIMACGHLIKNSFALGVILWIVVIASIPLIKMVAYIALYHLASAIIQPTGNKKMSDIASTLAKGCEFILSCTGIVVVLAIVVMVVCASVGTSIT